MGIDRRYAFPIGALERSMLFRTGCLLVDLYLEFSFIGSKLFTDSVSVAEKSLLVSAFPLSVVCGVNF